MFSNHDTPREMLTPFNNIIFHNHIPEKPFISHHYSFFVTLH